MHYRESHVKFFVLKQRMKGLEQVDAAPCPLCILPFSAHSSEQGEGHIATCKIPAIKASTKHQVFIYTCGEEGILISLLKTPH